MWMKNTSLALRSLVECQSWDDVLPDLLSIDNEEDVILAIRTLPYRVSDVQVIEAIEPLFLRKHRNAHVLYVAIGILEHIANNRDSDSQAKRSATLILNNFWKEAEEFGIKPKMIKIPAGEYRIGTDQCVDADEGPCHSVLLSSFLIGETPVTNYEFKAFSPTYKPDRHSENDKMPVTNITWYEASLYSRWILGTNGRLPTEAEWEAAARGPIQDGRQFPWGSTPDNNMANYDRSIEGSNIPGKYPPNEFGLYDVSGNVFEWCLDWYDGTYYDVAEIKDPRGPEKGRYKTMRGGCWARSAEVARCSYRVRQIPSTRDILVGFRLACTNNY